MSRSAFLSLLCLAFAACASGATAGSSPPAGPPARIVKTSTGTMVHLEPEATVSRRVLDFPPQRVWGAVEGAYEALGITAEVREEDSGTFGTRIYTQSRLGGSRTADLVRCGGQKVGPSATGGYRVRLSALSKVQPAPGGKTLLLIEVSGTGTSLGGTSTGPVQCVSTGKLERQIATLVAAQLKH